MICPEPSELQELVRELHQHGSAWLPAGSGSRLHWGPPVLPLTNGEPAPVLSTSRLNRVVEHCVGDFTVTVQAGLPLQQLQGELAAAGQWLALDWPWGSGPGGEGSGTVGGLVARGIAGGLRQRYLGVRDQVIGISLIRADGTSAKAGGKVVKNVAGYDLMRLFTGSWGSLGLISELTLRTFPLPQHRRGLLLQGPLPALEQLRQRCLRAALMPQRLDWCSSGLLAGENPGQPALLLACTSVSSAAIADQLQQHSQAAAALGLQVQNLDGDGLAQWEQAQRGPAIGSAGASGWLLQLGAKPMHGAALLEALEQAGLQGTLAAGVGLGLAWSPAGSGAAGSETASAPAALPSYRIEALRERCTSLGGFLNVLQQPSHQPALLAWTNSPARTVIEAIKREFDPRQQLARGRLPGVLS